MWQYDESQIHVLMMMTRTGLTRPYVHCEGNASLKKKQNVLLAITHYRGTKYFVAFSSGQRFVWQTHLADPSSIVSAIRQFLSWMGTFFSSSITFPWRDAETCQKGLNTFSIECKASNWFIFKRSRSATRFQWSNGWLLSLAYAARGLSCFLCFWICFSHHISMYSAPWNNPLSWISVPCPSSSSFQHKKCALVRVLLSPFRCGAYLKEIFLSFIWIFSGHHFYHVL